MADSPEVEPWPYAEADRHGWPEAADCADPDKFAEELWKAKLEVRKKRTDREIARAKAQADAAIAVEQEYYKSVLEVAKGAIDRTRASADTVQKAAAAIVTLYTGVLAVAFSVADNPLPGKAVFAAILLGLAILFSTAFLAYLPSMETLEDEERESRSANGARPGDSLTALFVLWTRKASLARARLLRASVVALAGAVALLPAPFVTVAGKEKEKPQIAWPTPAANAGENVELQKIVYTAQVAETVEQRKRPLANDSSDPFWTGAFAVFVLATLVVAFTPAPGAGPSRAKGTRRSPNATSNIAR